MFIDRNIDNYCISEKIPLVRALEALSNSKGQTLFIVDDFFRLKGTFTDGDFRRWIIRQQDIDLNRPVSEISNLTPVFAYDFEAPSQLAEKLSERIQFLPILDSENHVVGIASLQANQEITLGSHSINRDSPVLIIAEIGNNHNGSLALAKQLVDEAKAAGAHCAKFQMRDLDSLYAGASLGDGASEDLGSQYVLDLLQRFQLSDDDFIEIFNYCKAQGLTVLCTPFDHVSADKLDRYGMDGYKIASADLTNHELLEHIAQFGKPMLVSTGMSTEQEIFDAVNVLRRNAANFVLLHCNSTYPAPFKDVNLNYMDRLAEIGECLIGYSGHERGYHVAVAAVAKGAKVIEKHFTVDRDMEGNDHKVSLLPAEFRAMRDAIEQVSTSLGTNKPRNLSQGEMINREILGKSIVAAAPIKKGTRITETLVKIKSPGKGLPPSKLKELLGRIANRDLNADDFFYDSDIGGATIVPRNYHFQLRHGIPVRYHDYQALSGLSNLKLIEFHLSYRDLELNPGDFISPSDHLDFVVHAPELFAGDHTLDLCSHDEQYREQSVRELQRVIDITRKLNAFFPSTETPSIVVNVGGFSEHDFVDSTEKQARYALLERSLTQLDRTGVTLLAQTMPPFPWHFGGQRFHNLFVDPTEIADQSDKLGLGVCLDVSHSFLACNYFNWDFEDFIATVGPRTSHLHIADGQGVDGEGLQIGDGEMDFERLGQQLRECAPTATWIPEVWQGHKNGGEGFWRAFSYLDRLL